MQALYKALSRPESDLARSLELVALGIVADVAPQYGDTRYLLQRGLIELQRTTRPGLLALFQTARLADGVITATKIGFQIAPRLNAASRLGNVQLAIELLTTPDSSRAVLLAEQLNALNTRRRDLQRLMEAEITEQIKADPSLLRDYTALVIYGRDWQQGLLGPVAGRLAETYQRPVVLFSAADLNERELRGSARSAGSYHLVEGLAQVDHLLITYGGHAGAAGLSLQREQLDRFRQGLSLTLSRQPPSDSPIQITTIPHPLAQVTPQFARQLNWLAPFGEGNREPVFLADGVHIDHADFLDRAHDHRKLRIAEGEATHEVYWWGSGDQRVPKGKINLEYTIEVVKEKISLTARRVTDLEAQVTRAPRKLIDHRTLTDPAPQLSDFYAQYPDLVIWAEGFSATESPGVGRGELLSGLYRERPLLIYTIPPAGALLSAVINGVDPPVVILCGHQPLIPNLNKLRTLLGGVVNFVVNKQNGLVKIESLCIRTAQTEAAVKAVLTLFYESGDLDILRFEGDQVRLGLTDTPHRTEVGDLRKAQSAFAESQSYRAFYRSAPLTALIPERVDDEYPLPDPRADSPY
jgi:single-stranded-DNA-specific exonuclease